MIADMDGGLETKQKQMKKQIVQRNDKKRMSVQVWRTTTLRGDRLGFVASSAMPCDPQRSLAVQLRTA